MRERSIGIQELHASLGRRLDEVRRGTTLLLTNGEHGWPASSRGAGTDISAAGSHRVERVLKKTRPRVRQRDGGSMADIVTENCR